MSYTLLSPNLDDGGHHRPSSQCESSSLCFLRFGFRVSASMSSTVRRSFTTVPISTSSATMGWSRLFPVVFRFEITPIEPCSHCVQSSGKVSQHDIGTSEDMANTVINMTTVFLVPVTPGWNPRERRKQRTFSGGKSIFHPSTNKLQCF